MHHGKLQEFFVISCKATNMGSMELLCFGMDLKLQTVIVQLKAILY